MTPSENDSGSDNSTEQTCLLARSNASGSVSHVSQVSNTTSTYKTSPCPDSASSNSLQCSSKTISYTTTCSQNCPDKATATTTTTPTTCTQASEPTTTTATTIATTTATVDGCVNFSSNTLMVYRLQDMRTSSNTNLFLALMCLIYLGINVALVFVNYVNHKYMETHDPSEEENEPVNDTVYHLVEFWGTFGFAVVECVALAMTPKSQYRINGSMDPLFLRIVMFLNIVATIVPAVMISFSIETFEILSHEIEYINELTMSFVDVILLVSLWKSKSSSSSSASSSSSDSDFTSSGQVWLTTGIALLVAVVQLGVYNLLGYDEETQGMVGEVPGHFLEFSFEIISSLIAFWFCMDNKFVADKEIGLILYGSHQEDCQICENQATEFALDHNDYANNNRRPQQQQQYVPPPPLASASSYYQTV